MSHDDRPAETGDSANAFFLPLLILPLVWILCAGWLGRRVDRVTTQVLMWPAAWMVVNVCFGLFLLIPAFFLMFRSGGSAIIQTFPDICLMRPVGIPLLTSLWSAIFNLNAQTPWFTLDGTHPVLVIVVQVALLYFVKPMAEWIGDIVWFWPR